MALAPLPALKVADLISPHTDVLVDNSSDSVIDEGWRKIAMDLLSAWAAAVRQTPGARLSIRTVTERLGALRVICEAAAGLAPGYLDLHEVRHLQRESEILSLRTCGRCGEPGVLRCTPEGFATRCDTHADGIVGRLSDAESYLPLPAEVVQNALQSHGDWLMCDADASLEVPRGWLPLFVEMLVRLRDLPGTDCGFRLLEARGICGRLGIRLAHDPEGLPFHHFLRWRETLLAAADDAMFRCDVCGGTAWIRVTRRGGGTPAPRCDAHADMQRWQSRQQRIYDYSEDPLALVSSIRPQWTIEAIRGTAGASAGADTDRDPTPLPANAGALALYDLEDVASALGLANDDGDEHYCDAEPSPSDTEQQGRIRRIFEKGHAARWRQLARPDRAMVERFEALADRVPHLEALTSLIKRHLLAGIHMEMPIRLPPLLVVGPPGVGKTFFMTELARVLNVPFRNQPVSATSHADSIGGSHGAWRNASVGLVARTLLGEKVANPLIFIDEFDKVASEGLASDLYRPFYSLLEPVGARQFVDAFLTFPMDASQILWALAANDVAAIPTPILNRLTIVTVDAPDDAQMRKVASSVYADCNHRRGTFFPEQPSPTLVDRLAGLEPRRMRIAIDDAMTSAAAAGRSEILTEDLPDQRTPKRTRIGFV